MGASNGDDDGAETKSVDLASPDGILPYSEGEKVLAYHGPLLYEAKVQRVEPRKNEWRFHVHYLGWSKNWDEWVGTERLLKCTAENVKLQQALEKTQNLEKNARTGRSIHIRPKSSNDTKVDKEDHRTYGGRGKRKKIGTVLEEKAAGLTEKLLKLQFPPSLKRQLLDDWESVTRLGKLVSLPRSPNVDEILEKYTGYRVKKDGMLPDSVGEILKGLHGYFDKALPVMLLYKKERPQYVEAVSHNVSPSAIYGAEHLLRLFVKLPELLACVNMEEESSKKLQQKLLDFLKFLQKNQSAFFLSTYDGCCRSSEAIKEADS